ncbi:hypothetical protein RW115_01160 [Macrococcus capreoli]
MSEHFRYSITREVEMMFRAEADKILEHLLKTKSTFGDVEDAIRQMKYIAKHKDYKSIGVYDIALQKLNYKLRTTLIESGHDSK